MKDFARPLAVFLYGPPGSGKGTQAELLTENLGFFHFDSGDFLRKIFYGRARRLGKAVLQERRRYEAGELVTTSWFMRLAMHRIQALIRQKESIVLSGAFRNLEEAFGAGRKPGIVTAFHKGFGKNNLLFFLMDIPEHESVRRNSGRLLCSVCRSALIPQYLSRPARRCPLCAGALFHRTDDDRDIVQYRLMEYRKQTQSILRELRRRGYRIIRIDGRPLPYEIHKKIISYITRL